MKIIIKHPQLYIILIIWLAFGLRTYHLADQSLRGDEAATVLYSAMPITELWELSRITDPHPPLYYALLHPWQWLLGEAAWPMRFFGVIASTLAIALLYRLTYQTLSEKHIIQAQAKTSIPLITIISLGAAFFLAINPLQIWLAQDLRSYPLFMVMGLLSSFALWQAVGSKEQTANRKLQITNYSLQFTPYIFLTTACLYIHYYTVFLIAFQGLFVLLNLSHFRQRLGAWIISQIVIGILITPGLLLAYGFIGEAAGGIETIPTTEILQLASTAMLTGFTIEAEWGLLISLILLPVWMLGLISLLRFNWITGTFWGLFFAIPIIGVIGLSIGRPFFKERFLIQAQPALMVLLAVGFWRIANLKLTIVSNKIAKAQFFRQWLFSGIATVGLLLLLFVNSVSLSNYFTNPNYAKAKPWRLYHDHIKRHAEPGDVMLTNFPEASVSYYSPNQLPFYVVPEERDRSLSYRVERTAEIAKAYQRIWLLPLLHQGFDETGDVLTWLDRHADRVEQIFFPEYNLNLYLSPTVIETQMIRQPAQFQHGIQLRGFQIFDKAGHSRLRLPEHIVTREPEDELTLSLYWQANGPTAEPYTVFVHFIAEDGFNRVGQDNQPVWNSYPTTEWHSDELITDKYSLTLPPDTPPAPHRLRIGWYNSHTGERVSVVDDTGHIIDDWVILEVMIQVALAEK